MKFQYWYEVAMTAQFDAENIEDAERQVNAYIDRAFDGLGDYSYRLSDVYGPDVSEIFSQTTNFIPFPRASLSNCEEIRQQPQ